MASTSVFQTDDTGSIPVTDFAKNLIFSKFFAIIFIENETKNMPNNTVAGCKPKPRYRLPGGTGPLNES